MNEILPASDFPSPQEIEAKVRKYRVEYASDILSGILWIIADEMYRERVSLEDDLAIPWTEQEIQTQRDVWWHAE